MKRVLLKLHELNIFQTVRFPQILRKYTNEARKFTVTALITTYAHEIGGCALGGKRTKHATVTYKYRYRTPITFILLICNMHSITNTF